MASECSASFAVVFLIGVDASITQGTVSVTQRPGFNQIYYWTVTFMYVTGHPPATGFRLNSADGLSGTFFPPAPIVGEDPNEVRNGQCEGTIARVLPEGESATYTGTVTILQA